MNPGDMRVDIVELALKHYFVAEIASLNEFHKLRGNWEIQCFVEGVTHNLIARARTMFAAREIVAPVDIRYPRTWWDAVKERFGPKWFLRTWPVDYKTHHFEVFDVYPDLKLPRERTGDAVRYAVLREDDRSLFDGAVARPE